jgi:hypothetical protein
MLARRHQSAAALLPAAASFWFLASSVLPASATFGPPAQVFLSPTLLPAAASFWPALLPAAASFWPPAQVSMLARRHQSAVKLLPAAASFLARAAARRFIFLAPRTGIHARRKIIYRIEVGVAQNAQQKPPARPHPRTAHLILLFCCH